MQTILSSLRNLVYWMGIWPKPGSVLYSPSMALSRSYLNAIKKAKFPVVIDLANRPAWASTAMAIDQMKRDRFSTETSLTETIYGRMNFCIMCGSPLIPLVVDVKECPHQHGVVRPSETTKGLPGITFELTEETDEKWRPNN